MAKYKLVVGERIEFDVKFSLNDAGADKRFGIRVSARRQAQGDTERDFTDGVKVKEFLDERGVAMLAWIGAPALLDDAAEPVPAGPEALADLYELVGGMPGLMLTAYLQANNLKSRLGN